MKMWYIEIEECGNGIFDSKEKAIEEIKSFLKSFNNGSKIIGIEEIDNTEFFENYLIKIMWENDEENICTYWLEGLKVNTFLPA